MSIGALIVDDQEDFRVLAAMVIRSAGTDCRVVGEAASGLEAIEMMEQIEPDVVVLDEMMPGLTGLETATQLRERRPTLPIVLCSAHVDDEVRRKAQDRDIDVCMSKEEVTQLPQAIMVAAARRGIRS
jgi:CheY-like chemotaxis protein